ncbi:site-specific integrase [Sporosarcina sp. P21c]|uniref:tyrosine-type recombinase/integrase n=1 Tax=Sporosarcina sp. P21c TaxID=2048255 RepID=UPI0013041CEB|nr:site-specific integrase [Sporosarcina sp. P21c]
MASTEHLGGDKYKVYVELGTDSYGVRKRRTKTITATSARDLKKKALEFELQCLNEPIETYEDMTFAVLFDKWWTVHVEQHLAISTKTDYSYFKPMLVEYFGKMKVRKIKSLHIDEFFIRERDLGRKSLTAKLAVLKSLFGRAYEWEIILHNPMHRYKLKGAVKSKERSFYNEDELERFYMLLEKQSERNRLMLLATSLGGLRRGEVLGIGEDVIDYENNSITIKRSLNWDRGRKRKYLGETKGKEERVIIYPKFFMSELKRFAFKQNELRWSFGDQWEMVDDVDLLFRTSYGTIMHPQSFTNLWKKIRATLGLKEIDLHDLRHSAATYLIRNGESMKAVQEFLGHKDFETTMNRYVHVEVEDKQKLAQAFERLL